MKNEFKQRKSLLNFKNLESHKNSKLILDLGKLFFSR